MSSNQIAYALAQVKATSGRIAKEALLAQLQQEYPEESKRVMKAVFDKDITYGFAKKIPEPRLPTRTIRPRQFSPGTWALLDALANRELSGKVAEERVALHLGTLSAPSRELFVAILQQNLRAGFGIDVVVQIWGPIVETFDVCLSQEWRKEMYKNAKVRVAACKEEFEPKYHSGHFPVWADVKYDGLRGFFFERAPGLVSRKKLPLTCPPSLQKLLSEFLTEVRNYLALPANEELFLDVEVVSADGIFRDAMSNARASKKGAAEGSLVAKVIDVLLVSELHSGRSRANQRARRQLNETMFASPEFERFLPFVGLSEGRECANVAEVEAFAEEAWAEGLEGLIIKTYEGHWEGKRSYGWLKLKRENGGEPGSAKGRIKGYIMSDPRSKNAGKVGSVVMEEDSGVRTNVAGMTDEMRDYITEHQDELLDEQIEAMFHERTPDGKLRHPRLKAIRSDRE